MQQSNQGKFTTKHSQSGKETKKWDPRSLVKGGSSSWAVSARQVRGMESPGHLQPNVGICPELGCPSVPPGCHSLATPSLSRRENACFPPVPGDAAKCAAAPGRGAAGIPAPAVRGARAAQGCSPGATEQREPTLRLLGNGAACAGTRGKATAAPEQQRAAAHSWAQLALRRGRESLASAPRARWSRPRMLLEREKPELLVSGSALPRVCVVPSLTPFHLPASPLLPI